MSLIFFLVRNIFAKSNKYDRHIPVPVNVSMLRIRAEDISGVKIMLSRFKNFALLALAAMTIFGTAGIALSLDWNSYSPAHAVGFVSDDWWTAYPDQHEDSGSDAEHPAWVLDALKDKPLLVLVHSSNCKPCLTQTPRIKEAAESFSGDLSYYDVLAEGSSYEKAIKILDVYNPVGGAQYVPTTIFITLAKGQDGKVDVAWHSEIDAMSQKKIEAYVLDSIYYYKQNRAAWT
jgi:thiol-disulfide isomerase/thioredoxin